MNEIRAFGKFRLDAEKKVLWYQDEPIKIPLKEIELLCLLTDSSEIITKEEILEKVWQNSFVEESNLSSHIYRLRKMFAKYGEPENLIQNISKRGYRFTGEVVYLSNKPDLVIEKHSITKTLIEEIEETDEPNVKILKPKLQLNYYLFPLLALLLLSLATLGFYFHKQRNNSSFANIKTIAVLPIKSFSDDGSDKELRLKITDAIITRLSSSSQFFVKPTNSVLAFTDSNENSLEIGKKLKVNAILEGRVHREENRLRITLQLISIDSGEQILAQQIDGEADKILTLQDRISETLVAQFNQNTLEQNNIHLAKNPTGSSEAYENYLQGRYFFNQRGVSYLDSLKKAGNFFERAIELDPNFVEASVGLADVINLQTDTGNRNFENYDENYEKARTLAKKATELKPDLAEGYATLGFIQQRYDWNYDEAEKSFKKAIELKPNIINAYLWLSINYSNQGKADEALDYAKKAVEIEPTMPTALEFLILMYERHGDCQKAAELLLRLSQYQTEVYQGKVVQGEHLTFCGRCEEAIPLLKEANEIGLQKGNNSPRVHTNLGYCYAQTNQKEKARESLKVLNEKKNTGYSIFGRILIHANLGETQEALKILEESYETRDVRLTRLKADPRFKPIQSNSKFQEIMRKMNLP